MSEMTPDEFWAIVHGMPEAEPVFYRLYHTDDGHPICYSMDELPGNYIDVDVDTFQSRPFNVQVVNGKLIVIAPKITVQKLTPNGNNSTPCDPRDVAVVVDPTVPHTLWGTTLNDIE